jgi:S-adenosylmethionine:tRNA ribosyltransferase-isomerase
MNIEEFDYDLPEELIAQTPLNKRDQSRLLVVDKTSGEIKHEMFFNIVNYFDEGDTLVLNNTKVLPARLIGEKEDTKAVIEILLLKDLGSDVWECLTNPVEE